MVNKYIKEAFLFSYYIFKSGKTGPDVTVTSVLTLWPEPTDRAGLCGPGVRTPPGSTAPAHVSPREQCGEAGSVLTGDYM